MAKKLKVDIRTSSELFGGESYVVHIDITNLTNQTVEGVSVTPQYLPGKLIRELPTEGELNELKRRKIQLLEEMQLQIRLANLEANLKQGNFFYKFNIRGSILLARSIGLRDTAFLTRAYWAREYIRIEDWNDVDRLEKAFILPLSESSNLKRAFYLDKAKLQEIQDKISEMEQTKSEQTKSLRDVYSIQPGDSISFTFKAKAPLILRAKTYSLQFNISYTQNNNIASTFSSYQVVSFYASPFAIPVGAIVGSVIGYLVKVGLVGSTVFTWFNFFGSIALAIIFALLTVRTSTSKKLITTEDFIGGLVLGALVGISTEVILEKIRTIISKM